MFSAAIKKKLISLNFRSVKELRLPCSAIRSFKSLSCCQFRFSPFSDGSVSSHKATNELCSTVMGLWGGTQTSSRSTCEQNWCVCSSHRVSQNVQAKTEEEGRSKLCITYSMRWLRFFSSCHRFNHAFARRLRCTSPWTSPNPIKLKQEQRQLSLASPFPLPSSLLQ